jgi:hypothetical protein
LQERSHFLLIEGVSSDSGAQTKENRSVLGFVQELVDILSGRIYIAFYILDACEVK